MLTWLGTLFADCAGDILEGEVINCGLSLTFFFPLFSQTSLFEITWLTSVTLNSSRLCESLLSTDPLLELWLCDIWSDIFSKKRRIVSYQRPSCSMSEGLPTPRKNHIEIQISLLADRNTVLQKPLCVKFRNSFMQTLRKD